LNADYVATGHYARIDHHDDGSVRIYRGQDERKDQTYMLARVNPSDLRHTLFPLAYAQKTELVEMAKAINIPTAHSKESQDVCFILNGQANYLKQVLGETSGDIIDRDTGKTLGQHKGYYLYTLGQRRGIGVGAGRPVYVVEIDKDTNTVYVGDKHHLDASRFVTKHTNWIHPPPSDNFEAMVKIRYNTPAQLAQCEIQGDNVLVEFVEPISAITPGQIAAFYDPTDTELWGGGFIEDHLVHQPFEKGKRELPTYDEACGVFR